MQTGERAAVRALRPLWLRDSVAIITFMWGWSLHDGGLIGF